MFKIANNTFTDRGYLIETEDNITEYTVKICELESISANFEYTFKVFGTYPGQHNDLIDDCIDMYEREKNKI